MDAAGQRREKGHCPKQIDGILPLTMQDRVSPFRHGVNHRLSSLQQLVLILLTAMRESFRRLL